MLHTIGPGAARLSFRGQPESQRHLGPSLLPIGRTAAMTKTSLLVSLLETMLITAGGLLFVNMLATASDMSTSEMLVGPLSVGLVWLGMHGPRPHPPSAV